VEKRLKFLVLGDACIDEYRFGTVDRLNPEAPVPILNFSRVETKEGMAGNVYRNLVALGASVDLRIPAGDLTRKIRYIDQKSGMHLLRVDHEVPALEYAFKDDLTQYDALVVSDYNKGFVTDAVIRGLRDRFSGPIYMDTKKRDLGGIEDVWIKINQIEKDALTSLPPAERLIVTLGNRGCYYNGQHFPAKAINVVDVCGAGDTFLAAFAYQHTRTQNTPEALRFANRGSGITCQHIGVYAPTKEEILCTF